MREAPVLVADAVRRKLVAALQPIAAHVVESAALGLVDLERVRYVIQARPLVVRVIIAARPPQPARTPVPPIAGEALPDHGAALSEAIDELTAPILASLRPELAAGLAAYDATAGDGGLVAIVDLETEAAALLFAEPGVPLERATLLCGIGAAPGTVH